MIIFCVGYYCKENTEYVFPVGAGKEKYISNPCSSTSKTFYESKGLSLFLHRNGRLVVLDVMPLHVVVVGLYLQLCKEDV